MEVPVAMENIEGWIEFIFKNISMLPLMIIQNL